jgi:predicted ATPase/DNA-binding SARP family transcriptional activator
MLDVRLLGGFQLTLDGQPVAGVEAPRLQSLLAYLALQRATPQPRQRLAFLLYPDSAEGQARANLRGLLHGLRRALAEPGLDRWVQSEGPTLQWRAASDYRLDVEAFEQAAAANDRSAWERAVALYQGELLPGCYDDWIVPERERLQAVYRDVLGRLVRRLAAEGEYPRALPYAQQWLRHDPLHEPAYVELFRLYAQLGDRAAAQRTYQAGVEALQRELNTEPSAATRAAYAAALRLPVSGPAPPAARRNHNLPLQLTSFVGREQELARLTARLAETRLLTLTGAGGSGKTRLALQAAAALAPSMPDGTWLVELAPLTDPALVPLTVATVLGIHPEPGRPVALTVAEALAEQQLLLVLDNCEHLLRACAQLAEAVLRHSPGVHLLATSREHLNLRGEVVWPVPTLALPSGEPDQDQHALAWVEAIRLFVDRAGAAVPGFALTPENSPAIIEICTQLDGLPLAIELAAARVRTLSVTQIAARLGDAFRLLTRGSQDAPMRQQTLRATMDWSYRLLPQAERHLFERLAVFAGSFALDAAEAVAGEMQPAGEAVLEGLATLLDKSLVTRLDGQVAQQARYRLLEPIRQYALEKLAEAGEEAVRRRRHLDFYLQLAEQAAQKLEGAEQALWLDRLEAELANVRSALDWAVAQGETQSALQLAGRLQRLWFIRPHHVEGVEHLRALLARPEAAAPTRARLLALSAYLMMLWPQDDLQDRQALIDEALALSTALGDRWHQAFARLWAGNAALSRRDIAAAQASLEQSRALWIEVGDELYLAWSLVFLGEAALAEGRTEAASALFADSVARLRVRGDAPLLAIPLRRLGQLALARGDRVRGCQLILESLQANWAVRDLRGTAACLAALGEASWAHGERHTAAKLFGCVAAVLGFIRTPLLLYDQQQYELNSGRLAAEPEAAELRAAWTAGYALPRDRAVAWAVAWALAWELPQATEGMSPREGKPTLGATL